MTKIGPCTQLNTLKKSYFKPLIRGRGHDLEKLKVNNSTVTSKNTFVKQKQKCSFLYVEYSPKIRIHKKILFCMDKMLGNVNF